MHTILWAVVLRYSGTYFKSGNPGEETVLLLRLGEMPCPPAPPARPRGAGARRRRTIREAEKVVWSWCDPRESLAGPGAARPLCFHFGGHGGGCSLLHPTREHPTTNKCRKSMAHGGSEAHPPSPALRSDSARPAGLRGTAVRHTGRRVSRRRAARARLYCTAVWGRKAPGVVQITVKETCPTHLNFPNSPLAIAAWPNQDRTANAVADIQRCPPATKSPP